MKEIVKGIIASSGYAIGKAVYHETEDLSALNAEIKIAEPDEEIKKFDNAVSVCRQELQEIIVKMESEVNKNEASIFSAHMLILEDPMFYDEVKNTINSEKIDSVSAISKTTQKIAEEFKEIKDDYIKERIQDIKDVASRLVRIYRGKSNISSDMGFSYILVTDELYPSKMADLNKKEILGIITKRGGINSHAAIISRALGIPSIVGLKYDLSLLNDKKLIIDAVKGDVIIEPDGSDIQKYGKIIENNRLKEEQLKAFSDKETYTKDGQKIILCLNANSPDEYRNVIDNHPEGVGLFRSELFFMDRDLKPSEKEESEIYFKMSEAVKPEKVIIRLLDIGADKEIKYIKQQKEDNPALGLRGVRLMLSDNELIRSQLKAIITANKNSNIKIMAPMISAVEEVVKLRQIFNEICDEIKKENSSINTDIPLGIMIETPSAAVIADKFAEVSDFFSIGTNDLVQYVMASDRVNENVMNTYQTYNPAVWKLIENISKAGSKRSKEVGVCGEAGSVFGCIILFIGAGIRKLSVSPSKILKIREMISKITVKEAESVFKKAIRMSTAKEVEDMVNRFLIKKGYK